jgi:hypothetical protein
VTRSFPRLLHNGKPKAGTKLAQHDGGINRSCAGAWLLGEGQRGVFLDSSKYGRHARIADTNIAVPTNLEPFQPGKLGGVSYRSLNSTRSVLVTESAYATPNGNFTVTCSIYALDWHNYSPIMSQWFEGGSGRSFAIVGFSDGTIHAYSSSNGTDFRQYGTNAAIPLRTWTTISVVYPASGGTPLIYFNGVLQATTNSGTEAYLGLFNGNQTLAFGAAAVFAGSFWHTFNGRIEAARIDARAIIADEILWLYRNQFGAWQKEPRRSRYLGSGGAGAASGYPRTIVY